MGRFAFNEIIYSAQNSLIADIGDIGRFAYYQIIYNAKIAISLV